MTGGGVEGDLSDFSPRGCFYNTFFSHLKANKTSSAELNLCFM
jgi:hypothetical protein